MQIFVTSFANEHILGQHEQEIDPKQSINITCLHNAKNCCHSLLYHKALSNSLPLSPLAVQLADTLDF